MVGGGPGGNHRLRVHAPRYSGLSENGASSPLPQVPPAAGFSEKGPLLSPGPSLRLGLYDTGPGRSTLDTPVRPRLLHSRYISGPRCNPILVNPFRPVFTWKGPNRGRNVLRSPMLLFLSLQSHYSMASTRATPHRSHSLTLA